MAGIGRKDGVSGRKKGSRNKNALPLTQKVTELGVDPFEILLMFAKGDWKGLGYASAFNTLYTSRGEPYQVDIIQPEHRLRAAQEASQYLYPKRRAIEVKDNRNVGEDPLPHISDEELDEL